MITLCLVCMISVVPSHPLNLSFAKSSTFSGGSDGSPVIVGQKKLRQDVCQNCSAGRFSEALGANSSESCMRPGGKGTWVCLVGGFKP